jgi:hypothetical protein
MESEEHSDHVFCGCLLQVVPVVASKKMEAEE